MQTASRAIDPRYAHRGGRAEAVLTDPAGAPLAHREATVSQRRHAFGFGNIGFDFVGLANGDADDAPTAAFGGAKPSAAAALAPLWLDVFNLATLPFYWRGFEPERGKPDTERLLVTARWFQERGVDLKGHPLVWHTLAPEWLLGLPLEEVETVIRERVGRDVADFAGVIDLWDAINEVVILPVFTAEDNAVTRLAQVKGRVEMVRLAVDEARGANRAARLVLNDFDLSADYEHLIEEVLAAGVRLDAIGLQTHMHQGYRGEAQVTEILERFARFGLPLQLTETTLVSGDLMPADIVDLNDYQIPDWPTTPEGEARQADELERHYRTAFAHPSVESVTYWGIADEGAWLGAPAGLVRRDGSPKPAYDALRRLVKDEWWLAPTTVVTDADGRVAIEGYAGEYVVTCGDVEVTVTVASSAGAARR